MKLCSSHVESAETDLYRVVKQFYFDVESCGTLSIQVLQAGVLIALYELGHAIYPATFLSVGGCCRYATALGLDKDVSSRGYSKLPWIEEEEHRRVWWSLLILDRYVLSVACIIGQNLLRLLDRFLNLCDPGRHLITPDPEPGSYLPVDDAAWDAGVGTAHCIQQNMV